jgi:DNA-binding CsgD family transcriptional regulator
LTKNIIYLTEKNELLFNLKKTLQKLKSNLKDENKPSIQSVINEMTVSYNSKMWDEFEVHFINVHENFYENLNNNHPDLSQNEKRLAAFLKLNLSTKEISMITKQSIQSITVARTRLRKKLNLSNTDINLVSYLSKY